MASGGSGFQRVGVYKSSALVLSLFAALYLCITAIVAIPVFNDRATDVDKAKTALIEEMTKQPDQYTEQVTNVVLRDVTQFDIGSLRSRAKSLWTQGGTASPPGAEAERQEALKGYYRDFLLRIIDGYNEQNAAWQRAADELQRAATGFAGQAKTSLTRVGEYFAEQNTGRIGGVLTQQHAAILAASYNHWLAVYVARLEKCRASLLTEHDAIQARFGVIDQELTTRPAAGPPPGAPDELVRRNSDATAGGNGYAGWCTNIVPSEADYLTERHGPSDSLGFFGKAAKWLLATESRDLALITGLLGFGFFGALAASFIRQVAAQPDQVLPPAGWILPALIRGVAAAVLVFLAVVGGLAVFTQAGPEPAPNPYAVFFACFIAAVFSEDVWKWAREHGATGVSSAEQKGAAGKEIAANGHPTPPATPAAPEATRT